MSCTPKTGFAAANVLVYPRTFRMYHAEKNPARTTNVHRLSLQTTSPLSAHKQGPVCPKQYNDNQIKQLVGQAPHPPAPARSVQSALDESICPTLSSPSPRLICRLSSLPRVSRPVPILFILVPKLDDTVPTGGGDPARLQRVPCDVDAGTVVVALCWKKGQRL